jgi:hypothetical protein
MRALERKEAKFSSKWFGVPPGLPATTGSETVRRSLIAAEDGGARMGA